MQLFYVKNHVSQAHPIPAWHWTWIVMRLYAGGGFSLGASCLVLTAPHFWSRGHCSPCSPKILCHPLILRVLSTHLGFEKSQSERSKLYIGRFYVTQAPGARSLVFLLQPEVNTEPSFWLCFLFNGYFKMIAQKCSREAVSESDDKNSYVVWLNACFPFRCLTVLPSSCSGLRSLHSWPTVLEVWCWRWHHL